MKKIIFILSVLTISVSANSQIISTKYFFKPRPILKEESGSLTEKFDIKPIAQIPAIKLTESSRENAQVDATLLVSAGGGFTIQRINTKKGKNYAPWSFSPVTILLSGDTSKEGAVLDFSWCSTLGFFNNVLQIGVGYDFGEVQNRSRWFGCLSLGINLTNN
jgi:hypothetical protein